MKKRRIMKTMIVALASCALLFSSCGQAQHPTQTSAGEAEVATTMEITVDSSGWNELTPEEEHVIVHKGTEYPGTGTYVHNKEKGVYECKRCNQALFTSESKFNSGTGWPSFDDFIGEGVAVVLDEDGYREEIVCSNCKGHLGHVFYGEGFTNKNTRHCVNSISLTFVSEKELKKREESTMNTTTETAIFASGCFWGTEYFFEKEAGVLETQVGYIGGTKDNPTYEEVCAHTTGHAEAVKVTYDSTKTDYETLCRLFFETHDPTQVNRQGPDIGDQYRTEIFYLNDSQLEIAEKLKGILEEKGMVVATNITDASSLPFWDAEDYHEHYYSNKGGTPYCHGYTKRF